jgi:hypothetical protein
MATLFSVDLFPHHIEAISISLPLNTELLIRWPLQNAIAAPPPFHWLLFTVTRRAKEQMAKYKINRLRKLTTGTGIIHSLLSQPTVNLSW